MTVDQIELALGGDSEAFRRLTEPHRRELQAHCYRMLGSLHDAEDTVQNTLLAAWRGLAGFERRSSLRTWLYRIATNQCLSALRSAKRRPATEVDMSAVDLPEPTHRGEIVWLEPFPDAAFDAAEVVALGPEARYDQQEAISLAFVTALQVLPARQRAVLILREVLGYSAKEVAEMLDATTVSVNSALKRARTALQQHRLEADATPLVPNSPAERALVSQFVTAYQAGDVDGVIDLLTADVRLSMPPVPLEYHGSDAVRRFYAHVFRSRTYSLVPTRANGQPAFGAYLHTDGGVVRRASGLLVLSVAGDRISGLTRFDNDVLPWFGLPRTL